MALSGANALPEASRLYEDTLQDLILLTVIASGAKRSRAIEALSVLECRLDRRVGLRPPRDDVLDAM